MNLLMLLLRIYIKLPTTYHSTFISGNMISQNIRPLTKLP